MGHVFLVAIALLAAIKGIDGYMWAPWFAVLWWAICLLCVRFRFMWLVLGVLAALAWAQVPGMNSNATVLIAWVGIILAICTGETRDLLLRVQTSAVYLFGTLNKMNAHYLTGATIAQRSEFFGRPAFALFGLLAECYLAWGVWNRQRAALPVAIALHLTIVVSMSTRLYQWVLLLGFNAMMVVLVWWTTRCPYDVRSAWRRPALAAT